MSLSNLSFSYDELGKITANGIETAQFPQIRDAIIKEMKSIYGNDIDLSAASVDNQYINMEALILNNVYRLVDNLYMQVNPFTATGKYLDILCSLTNVHRKDATPSTAKLYVRVSQALSQQPTRIELHDRSDNIWYWDNTTDLVGNLITTFEPNVPQVIEFTCSIRGAISAARASTQVVDPSAINWNAANFEEINGDIYHVDFAGPDTVYFKVYQNWDAVIGNNEETDTSLKSRRYSYIGQNSVTTMAGLEADLYESPMIDDVYIINNVTGTSKAVETVMGTTESDTKDDTVIANHDIYIALRYSDVYPTDDDEIANLIYNSLTPGVNTTGYVSATAPDEDSGENKSIDLQIATGITTSIKWKKCTAIHPEITVQFVTQQGFIPGQTSGGTYEYSDLENAMIDSALNYLKNIGLNEAVLISGLQTVILNADSLYKGQHTFYMTDSYVDTGSEHVKRFVAPLTYFEYDKNDVSLSYSTSGGVTTGTLVFS